MNPVEEKEFDCVQFMRQERDKISKEIMHLSPEDRVQHFQNYSYSDSFLKNLADKLKSPHEITNQ